MPEELAQTAESSPAPAEPVEVPAGPSVADRVKALKGDDRQKWQLTGELPEVKIAEPDKGKNEPESAPGTEEPRSLTVDERSKRDRARGETRRLTYAYKKMGEKEAALEAANRRIAELEKKPESAPGAPTGKLRLEDFPTVEEYTEAVAEAKAGARVDALEKQRIDAEARAEQEEAAAELKTQREDDYEAYRSREEAHAKTSATYPAAKAAVGKALDTIFGGDANDPKNAGVDRYIDKFLVRSNVGHAIIDHLYAHIDEFKELVALPKDEALVRLGELQAMARRAPKPNTITKVNDPPAALGGKSEAVTGPKVGSDAWKKAEDDAYIARRGSR